MASASVAEERNRRLQFRIRIEGHSPLITHNGVRGLDSRSPEKGKIAELTRKKGSDRTEVEEQQIRALECRQSLYVDDATGAITFPAAAIRSSIETGARKLKQGPLVREGMVMDRLERFEYDADKLGVTEDDVAIQAQFTVPVVVQRARILRTRAKFDTWAIVFTVDCDDELVDREKLTKWLEIAGRRIGLGDWRPEKSGMHGRFTVASIEAI